MVSLDDYKKAEQINWEILKLAKERLLSLPEGIKGDTYPLRDFKPQRIDYNYDTVELKYEEMWCDGFIFKVIIPVERIVDEVEWKSWLDEELQKLEEKRLIKEKKEFEKKMKKEEEDRLTFERLKAKYEGDEDA